MVGEVDRPGDAEAADLLEVYGCEEAAYLRLVGLQLVDAGGAEVSVCEGAERARVPAHRARSVDAEWGFADIHHEQKPGAEV